ncbi:hypothetical protein QT17_04840 [Thermus sp. 2.9]|uniref:hypothetical protein n=1 Tax=Thermus sp. (strain 2.9) TaxID=1577051 RepID=UPI000542B406|nr:hypothetical protein [Thermus sp. 2.9]KHG65867.1 hypothetical protein QT17_04840 [Thermus sp. 2.9]
MGRLVLLLALLGSLALAGPCANRPYTLETEEGLLGGEELSYDGEELVFEGRACLEREGLFLEAPLIRYREEEKAFFAENLTGEAEGWRLEAKRLEGKTLKGVRLAQGRLRAEAESILLERPPLGQGVYLESPAYRLKAEEARFNQREALLKGFLATPCPCGEDVRLSMGEARFDVATGELVGEASLGLWNLEIPIGEARANANRKPTLESPLVLGSTPDGGWSLGVRNFPLPRPGEEIGRWKRRFTLLATGLGAGQEALVLGYREEGRGMEAQLGYAPGVWAFFDDLYFAASPNPPDADTPRLEVRYRPTFRLENLSLSPFLRYAETGRSQGWTLGLEAGYRAAFQEGPFRFFLAPSLLFSVYPGTGYHPYLALGGSLEGEFEEGDLRLRTGYAGRLEPLGPTPPFTYENRDEFQRFSLEGAYGPMGLSYILENPLANRLEQLEGRFQDPSFGSLRVAYVRGSLEEVRLAYAMPLPERTCCQALWLAPEVGLSGGGLSRYGLTFRYYDGCFAYELKVQNVLKGQYSETTGLSLAFGLALR